MFFTLWAHLSYFLKDFLLYLILLPTSFAALIFSTFKIFKSKIPLAKKKTYIAGLFAFFVVILVYCILEAYFRYAYDQSDGLGFLKVNQRWQQRHVVFNSDFFRDRDFNRIKEPETKRICALGDSLTFGGGIENVDDRFSNLLEKKLNRAGYKVEVYNMGKSGYDTEAETEVYESKKDLNCDIIVWEYFLNDIQPKDDSTGTPIISRGSQTTNLVSFISGKSYFFDYLFWRFSSRYRDTFQLLKNADLERYKEPQTLDRHKEVIGKFTKQLKNDNKEVIVIIFPFVQQLTNYPATEIHRQMTRFFQENGVGVIDLLNDLNGRDPETLVASKFDSHPNEYVHALAAQKLFEAISIYLQKK